MQMTFAPPRCAVIVTNSVRVRTFSTEICRLAFLDGPASSSVVPEAGASSSAYNYGYVNTAGKFRDIMSYPNKCAALRIICRSITCYSNPWKSYLGYPIGIPTGQPGAANNARKLRENIAGLAAFR